jgi:hypothetical protein
MINQSHETFKHTLMYKAYMPVYESYKALLESLLKNPDISRAVELYEEGLKYQKIINVCEEVMRRFDSEPDLGKLYVLYVKLFMKNKDNEIHSLQKKVENEFMEKYPDLASTFNYSNNSFKEDVH